MRLCLVVLALMLVGFFSQSGLAQAEKARDPKAAALASEVRDKGWIIYSAKTDAGDWDLYLMRPDGSNRRNVTNTPAFNEAGAKFSPDGHRLLYYRMSKGTPVDNNKYGLFELVLADADGANAEVWGNGFQWASWGPEGKSLACLSIEGIDIVDVSSREVTRSLARKGIVQQLTWSPDGKWFAGTANGLGVAWAIGRLNAESAQINAVSETDRYNCTPDWFPDSWHVIYSRGIIPGKMDWAQLWMANGDGGERRMLYAEEGRHMYGGCVSPDGKYVLFTRSQQDLGEVDQSNTTMAVIRYEDTPMAPARISGATDFSGPRGAQREKALPACLSRESTSSMCPAGKSLAAWPARGSCSSSSGRRMANGSSARPTGLASHGPSAG